MQQIANPKVKPHQNPQRAKLYQIIFGVETKMGKIFDVILLWLILGSVVVVLLESVNAIQTSYGMYLRIFEWVFTILFTIEYILRCYCVKNTSQYTKSFFGVIDLLSICPTYLGLFLSGAHSLVVIRALRLLRVFRVLKLGRYLSELEILVKALKSSWDKIAVLFSVIVTITVISGTVMYLVEGEAHGFTSIPKSIYWAIVTMTTVGYGDIAPQTVFGQFLASIIMIMGYAIIVVPTGIFSVELSKASNDSKNTHKCTFCNNENHLQSAKFCCQCGKIIAPSTIQ